MKLTQLQIKRNESWETPANTLTGFVHIAGETGEQRINLSPGAIRRIIGQVAGEVAKGAQAQAGNVGDCLEDTQQELALTQSDGLLITMEEGEKE
jgi:hypothetical protein